MRCRRDSRLIGTSSFACPASRCAQPTRLTSSMIKRDNAMRKSLLYKELKANLRHTPSARQSTAES